MRTTLAVRANAPQRQNSLKKKPLKNKTRIAVWDVGVSVGDLKLILDRWNKLNGRFVFMQVFVSAPRQVLVAGERTLAEAKKWLKDEVNEYKEQLCNNLFSDSAMIVAEKVRKKLGYDKIALLTPHMLAFTDAEGFKFDHRSVSEGNVIIVSAFEMRDFARKAGRPFAAAMGNLLISQVLSNSYPSLIFHDESRGCMFDYYTVVETFKLTQIEPSCLNLLPQEARAYAEKLVSVLTNYS